MKKEIQNKNPQIHKRILPEQVINFVKREKTPKKDNRKSSYQLVHNVCISRVSLSVSYLTRSRLSHIFFSNFHSSLLTLLIKNTHLLFTEKSLLCLIRNNWHLELTLNWIIQYLPTGFSSFQIDSSRV